MAVHKAVQRLRADIKRLNKAERELKNDKRDLRKDVRELKKDRNELLRDRKDLKKSDKALDKAVNVRERHLANRDAQLGNLDSRMEQVRSQLAADTFDYDAATPGVQQNPELLQQLANLAQRRSDVAAKFTGLLDQDRARVDTARSAKKQDVLEVRNGRKEVVHDRKVVKHDRLELKRDHKAIKHYRHVALKHLRPAEYQMGLKATNRVRKELGLEPVDHVIRPVSAKVEKMLDIARANLGYHEGAGNSNKFSSAMGRPAEAWCADFVSYLAKKAGLGTVNTASAQGIADQLAAKGRWKGKNNPQPGDAVTFDWSGRGGWADHVGIVEKVFMRNGRKYVQTIEGNSGDAVRRKVYPANDPVINGFGRIA